MDKENNYNKLKKYIKELGIDLFGVADIDNIREGFHLSEKTKAQFSRAISIGVQLSRAVLEDIDQEPTKLYYHYYRMANLFLDQAAFKISKFIQSQGCLALPIPASQIIDWQKQKAHLPHRKIGQLAGLGWIGRNNLLVNLEFGAQLRLASVLTDLPLKIDSPSKKGCGDCKNCLTVCPVSAIKEKQEDFNYLSCFDKLKEFQKKGVVGQYICGICVKACTSRK